LSEAVVKKRRPVKRWIVLALILAGIYCAYLGPTYLRPISPVVSVPGEPIGISIGGFEITNTILATLLSDVILIIMAISAYRFLARGNLVPSGFYNLFETLVEFTWNTVQGASAKWARRILPITATIFLLIFVANMVKMIPGFESIGLIESSHADRAYAPYELFKVGGLTVYTLDKGQPVEPVHIEGGEAAAAEGEHAEETEEVCTACEVIPYLRGSATDLNFTFGLAISAVVLTQVFGVMALGPKYFEKFFQFRKLISGGVFGIIDFGVGFLEIILEFAKILSFGFRLFGNIFAGALLLSIIGALLPVIIPPGLYLFEVFFGVIQAYVFFLLATIFISSATVGHGGEEHH